MSILVIAEHDNTNLKGATLIRLTEFAELQSDLNKKIKSLNDLKNKVSNFLSMYKSLTFIQTSN